MEPLWSGGAKGLEECIEDGHEVMDVGKPLRDGDVLLGNLGVVVANLGLGALVVKV